MLPYTETGDKHYGVSMENYQRCRQKEPPHSFDFAQDGEPVVLGTPYGEPLADVSYLEMVPLRLAPLSSECDLLDQHPHRPKGTLGGGHNPVN